MKWFEVALVVTTFATGIIWLLDRLFFAKRRAARAGLLDDDSEPAIVDYSRAFFPVLALVLVLRSFVVEPYKIPSSSMMPNLLIGDFILVNKFSYGLRLPITNTKILPLGEPARGDVVVFKPPHAPDQNWVKRIIGLPGDHIVFRGDTLFINGSPVRSQRLGEYVGRGSGAEATGAALLMEDLPGHPHKVLEWLGAYNSAGQGEWTVPERHYFVMGDNRDNSEDSRFWTPMHFLPEENLRGRAFLIWLNCEGWFCKKGFDSSRIGTRIQ
ncbi:MAG: signal peptidase I [Xanthomonadaceae bacterium]|jgi:signal peptidase I|nr:signal peptidase I [Xanthomonadaceae bacterium]